MKCVLGFDDQRRIEGNSISLDEASFGVLWTAVEVTGREYLKLPIIYKMPFDDKWRLTCTPVEYVDERNPKFYECPGCVYYRNI